MKLNPIYKEKNGVKAWTVQYTDPLTGKRKYKRKKTKGEIDKWIRDFKKQQEEYGKQAMNILTDPKVAADMTTAYQLISKYNLNLYEVVDFYMSHHKVGSKVKDVVEMYLDQKRKDGTREQTIRNIQNGMNQLLKVFGEREINSITSIEFTDWMFDLEGSLGTKKHYRTLAFGLFKYAFGRNIIQANIIEKVPIPNVAKKMVEYYDRETIEKWITETEDNEIKLFLAIGAYTGMRPTEVSRLTWEMIHLERKVVEIPPEVSKTGDLRRMDIEPKLYDILKDRVRNGSIFSVKDFGNSRRFKVWRATRKWIQDGLRKTFASHHISAYENSGKTALLLGHQGNPRMLHKHYYKAGISKEEGRAYFGIKEEKTK